MTATANAACPHCGWQVYACPVRPTKAQAQAFWDGVTATMRPEELAKVLAIMGSEPVPKFRRCGGCDDDPQ